VGLAHLSAGRGLITVSFHYNSYKQRHVDKTINTPFDKEWNNINYLLIKN